MKDNAYLKEKAGHEVVKVEQRSSPAVGFGTGLPKVTMPFGHLVDQIASGADQYYLTTQYEEVCTILHLQWDGFSWYLLTCPVMAFYTLDCKGER